MIAPHRSALPAVLVIAAVANMAVVLGAMPTFTFDLLSPPPGANVTRIFGRGLANDGAQGVPVCGGHDCDGDGHPDIAFAQFRGDPLGRTGAGEITVVFGDGTIGGSADSNVPQAGILRIAGAQFYETAGAEIWIDDVTGDGLGDLLIGRQNYSLEFPPPMLPRVACGGLTILVGSAAWKTQAATLAYLDLAAPPPGLQVITFAGPSDYDRLGIWMRTGDIDGDGVADLLVGADEVDGPGEAISQNQGAAFVIRGGPHLLDAPDEVDLAAFGQAAFPESLKGNVAWIDAPAGSANYHFGGTVQVGDLDGNRRSEILVAATLNRAGASLKLPGAPSGTGQASGGTSDGTLYIVWDENFPPGPWPEDHRFAVTSPPFGQYTAIDGDAAAQSFGEEILAGLDFSGDGFADLMVGDLVADPFGRSNAGRGYIFYNAANLRGLDFDLDSPPAGLALTIIDGPAPNAISSDTALHGDFDGDGIGDLGLGNPHDTVLGRNEAGSVHVLYGQPGGWPAAIDLAPAALPGPDQIRLAHVLGAKGTSGSSRGDTLCYSAASGDLNGDGRPDLIVNEMAGDAFGGSPDDVGNMIVIDAASLLAPFEPTLALVPAASGPLDFGTVQAGGGSAMRSVTITNTRAGPVAINSLEVAGPRASEFAITADSGELLLGAGEGRTVTVTFTPAQVGRSGAALVLHTDSDLHPVAFGLAGRAVNDAYMTPSRIFHLFGNHAVLEVPSQFGTDYTFTRASSLEDSSPPELFTVPGNGQTLYLTDPNVVDLLPRAFYRVFVERN